MNVEQQRPKVGTDLFVLDGRKLLLGKRINGFGAGAWCLPGGHPEGGESLVAAVGRELTEETGMVAEEIEYLRTINDPDCGEHYVHISFIARKWSGIPQVTEPEKFEEWKWFDLDDLPKNIFGGHTKMIDAFLADGPVFID